MSFVLQAWSVCLVAGAFIGTVVVIVGKTRKEAK